MTDNKIVEILKSALLLEKRGEAFYGQMAASSSDDDVKAFFQLMADEEAVHVDILTKHLKEYGVSGKFVSGGYITDEMSKVSESVLTKNIKNKISGAGFEAAAIGAAIGMEHNAIKLYSQRAKETDNKDEKELYEWLTKWETVHLNELVVIDNDLKENIWADNNFWPYQQV